MKFGGTSVQDAAAMRNVVSIVRDELQRMHTARPERTLFPVVVASACAGVTDELLACARAVGNGNAARAHAIGSELRRRHHEVLHDIGGNDVARAAAELDALVDELEQVIEGVALLEELTPRSLDLFASFGERLSTMLLARAFNTAGMRAALLDSRRVVITDNRHTEARPLMDEIDLRLSRCLLEVVDRHDVIVAQGFIGATLEGATTTIGRGGSDHTGALFGAALGADEIQIWTDVSGILTADPRLVPDARVVEEVTFSEARELALFGAKVLHPDTILPAISRNVPVVVRNSMRPEDAGTRILPDDAPVAQGVHSISARTGMVLLRLTPRAETGSHGPATAPLVLSRHTVPLLLFQLIEGVGLAAVPADAFDDIVLADLEESCHVEPRMGVALLCLCGASMDDKPAGLAEAIDALRGLSLPLAASGPSKHVQLLAVDASEVAEAVAAVHGRLFTAMAATM